MPIENHGARPLPFRLALAGGWIDQPFVSRLNPDPPGAMVVVSIEADPRFMDRSGLATSTRKTALRLWGDALPKGNPAALIRELYEAENLGRVEPSGSQDMAGLVYPGVSRLDYDFRVGGGVFPAHVESNTEAGTAAWLESVLGLVSVAPRPDGYDPLGVKNLEPEWVGRLGRSGKACYAAIEARDVAALGAAMNECMLCWRTLLPQTVVHPALRCDLEAILAGYQSRYPGAMYSGCGGGYVIVVSEGPIAGALRVKIRLPFRPELIQSARKPKGPEA